MVDGTVDAAVSLPAMLGSARVRLVPIGFGVLLCAMFFGLGETAAGLRVSYTPPFTNHPPGELYFWLAHALLVVPGTALIGYGLAPWLSALLARAGDRFDGMTRRELIAALVATALLGTLIARACHAAILLDTPITDDELAVRFGGQVLATGAVKVDAPPMLRHTSLLFLVVDGEGRVTSMDWLGGQVAWAIAELSRLGPLVFALLAALPLAAVGFTVGRLLGRPLGAAAAGLLLLSPMAFALSMTTHSHLVSRAAIAIAIACYVVARDGQRAGPWLGCGLALGAALLARPFETATLLAPLSVSIIVDAARGDARARSGIIYALGGVAPALALFALHNWAVTGNPAVPARFDDGAFHNQLSSGTLGGLDVVWNRFGANAAYNVLMLAVWFLGPLGVALVALGARANRLCALLGAGVLANLALALAHDNHGIHIVGPIHYSEAVIPLAIMAAHGLAAARAWLRDAWPTATAMVCAAAVLGLGLFDGWNARWLRRQAEIHDHIYAILDDPGRPPNVVLAPRYADLWRAIPGFAQAGSWVLEWRKPSPSGTDNAIVIHDRPGIERDVAAAYPDRALYRMMPTSQSPWLVVVPLAPEESE